jgi:nicotinamide-nucleotide adenylyltransferase
MSKEFDKIGLIARFKPLHLGAAAMLETVCEQASSVTIGIGSANKYSARNPFTAEECEGMVRAFLADKYTNFSIVQIPDSAHLPGGEDGKLWKEDIREAYGQLDVFVTGNPYVAELLHDTYRIIHPAEIIPSHKHIPLCATDVRLLMAKNNDDWERLVPSAVATYIRTNELDVRFRREFGLETIATAPFAVRQATADDERINVKYQ